MSEPVPHRTTEARRVGLDTSPWARLLRQDVDAIVDELCAGRPRDLVTECREHVEDTAYFVEEGRVAAKAIATIADLAGRPVEEALDAIETVVEDSTAEVLAEGPLGVGEVDLTDDPLDDDPPLAVALSRRLGVDPRAALRAIPRLNALGFDERHVVYHCLVGAHDPSSYAEAFGCDRRDVAETLDGVVRMAVAEARSSGIS